MKRQTSAPATASPLANETASASANGIDAIARTIAVVFALSLASLVSFASAGGTAVASQTKSHVSYTMQQAWQGRLDYYESCAECHGGKLDGQFGPALAGGDDNLQFQSVKAVYAYMSAHMPHGNPEGLPQAQYVAIMAFLMQSHGIAAGPRPLTKPAIDTDTALMGNGR
jgi:mono/diheme cytochrome c family protein